MDNARHTLVMKFGGTSVGSHDALKNVLAIVKDARSDWDQVVVVTSAFSGVTDALLQSAQRAAQADLSFFEQSQVMLRERHFDALQEFVTNQQQRTRAETEVNDLLSTFSNLVRAIAVLGEASPRVLDAVVGLGERLAVRVLAAALQAHGSKVQAIEATRVIVSDNQFQSAVPDMEATCKQTNAVLQPLLNDGITPVVTGFIAATRDGIPTTLGRGGSDYSAAILAVALHADEVWIWTDVDGVMTADPRLAPDARTIAELSYREVSELAYFGAKVLHPKTIRPVVEAGIKLRVLNTFNPDNQGTRITDNGEEYHNGTIIKAVTAIRNVQLITVEGRGMLGVPGVAARILSAVATTGATVPMITEASSEQSLCFAVPSVSTQAVLTVLQQTLAGEIERRNIDRIWATDEVVIVTVVCPNMRTRLGVAGKVFSALGDSGVNVFAIAHGSSEVSISLVVSVDDLKTTISALHQLTVTESNPIP